MKPIRFFSFLIFLVSLSCSQSVPKTYCPELVKLAEQGNSEAQNILGYCYATGNGVSQNYSEAVKWWRKSAEQGNAKAQFNLGKCYAHGDGVSQDFSEAVKWYRLAAEQGQKYAQYNLGCCYYNGTGVTQNRQEAFKYFRQAAAQGHNGAIKFLESLGEKP